jgi:transposase
MSLVFLEPSTSLVTSAISIRPERILGRSGPHDKKGDMEGMDGTIIGIDISKDKLDGHRLTDGAERQFANTAKGYRQLVKWLGSPADQKLVYEATGAYHRRFERAMAAAGFALFKINPKWSRRFAETCGELAKTDRIDAALLAQLGAAKPLRATVLPSQELENMHQLLLARDALMKDRTAVLNRRGQHALAFLQRLTRQRLAAIDQDIAAIDDELERLCRAESELAERLDLLISIPGISTTTAILLIVEMPELGALEPAQAASLAGLAPFTRESGKWRGKSFIRGGRARVRRALYMPAVVATQYNPGLGAKYRALKAAGKPSKVALTAIMRKLVLLANALLRDGRKWTENPA